MLIKVYEHEKGCNGGYYLEPDSDGIYKCPNCKLDIPHWEIEYATRGGTGDDVLMTYTRVRVHGDKSRHYQPILATLEGVLIIC